MAEDEVKSGEEQEVRDPGLITLTPEQYAGLLDKIEALEEKQSRRTFTLDELAEEGNIRPLKRKEEVEEKAKVRQDVDLDQMTNKQLVDYIFEVVDEAAKPIFSQIQQVDAKIETLRVLREIEKLEKDPVTLNKEDPNNPEKKISDFWDYKDEIYKVASENPGLSLKQVYKLVKGDSKASPDKKEGKLHALPPKPVFGERPGHSSSVTEKNPPKTTQEAAEKAWKETLGGKNEL
jgi:hypothetical protein